MPLWTARPAAHSLRHLGKGRAKAQGPGRGWLSCPTCAHSEVKLSVVTYLTNSIVDEILQELYHSHKSLVRLLNPSQARAHPHPTSPYLPQATLSQSPGKRAASQGTCSHLSFLRPGTWPS